MKFTTTLLPLLMLVGCLTACPESGHYTPPPQPPAAKPPDPAPKAELEKKIEVEQSLRQHTEALLEKQQSTTSAWQSLALMATAAAAALLVVGTALGAKARHDASTSQPE